MLGISDPLSVPVGRYFDPTFFELERQKLWGRAWQMACRLEEIPSVGDFTEYSICDRSVLIVRSAPGVVKAYGNACRHRATQLATGSGSLRGGRIVCPFHGWQWDLEGRNTFVYGEQGFSPECLEPGEVALREYRVGCWGGCVFVSFDPAARPLQEALAPIAELLDPLGVERMRVDWWKCTVLEANWKLAQEAFLEGFHVMQTHPQLNVGVPDDPDAQAYFVHPNGHSHFENRPGRSRTPDGVDPMDVLIESSRRLYEGLEAMTLKRDLLAIEGLRGEEARGPLGQRVLQAIYASAAAAGVSLPALDASEIARWGGVFFVFPNYFVLPQYGNALIYRSRPNGMDPESCLFEVWSVTIPPDGTEAPRPVREGPFDPADADAWPVIPLQDFSNIERQQRGIHTVGFEHLRLSERYEGGISNMHGELDRYLAR